MSGNDAVRVAEWGEIGWLRHGFSTRVGGVSQVYGSKSLNLGWTKEDDPACVAENRRRFLEAVSGEGAPMRLVTARQVHSGVVRVVGQGDGALEGRLETPEGKAVLEGDGLVTDLPGVLLGVGTADCVPVLVADTARRAVGAFHAGWRGTVARIVEEGIAEMRREYGTRAEDLVAAVGPSIGACCYAVGDEVREQFVCEFGYGEELFRRDDEEMFVDLWEANRRQLLDAGVGAERIVVVGECTGCALDAEGERRYFSHRVERGVAGRMLNVVGIAG
ncbi:peptidoglycan editing factor PgeF [Edaphobacter aggregans]|uniref:peptidoglycan editing factor PgeF n=1 Tax=Edaphobacter aggregans TaxID=570835 RepID=UPI000557AE9D|nr:peptidoglycan editing factor PgeF [Edaphobacter aggregans]